MCINKSFVTAGKAVFTVEIPAAFAAAHQTPAHYTYRVSYKPAEGKYREAWFVSLFTGTDNTRHYSYLGMLNAQEGTLRLTAGSKLKDDAWAVKLLRRLLTRIWASQEAEIAKAGFQLHHEGQCCRCGRSLTVPESIKNGVGPECIKHMAA